MSVCFGESTRTAPQVVVTDTWFVRQKRKVLPRLRLFCFPYAGGGASVFRNWAAELGTDIELAALQLPGREGRMGEAARSDMLALSREVAEAMQPHVDTPYVICGHSMGALLAYTVCLALRQGGETLPERLIVSAARPPHIPEAAPLHHLSDEEFKNALRRFSGTPEAILDNEELMEIFLPMLRADFALEETYCHAPADALPMPITAISGIYDREVCPEDMTLWAGYSTGGFEQHRIEGGHFFINDQQKETVGIVRASIAKHLD